MLCVPLAQRPLLDHLHPYVINGLLLSVVVGPEIVASHRHIALRVLEVRRDSRPLRVIIVAACSTRVKAGVHGRQIPRRPLLLCRTAKALLGHSCSDR